MLNISVLLQSPWCIDRTVDDYSTLRLIAQSLTWVHCVHKLQYTWQFRVVLSFSYFVRGNNYQDEVKSVQHGVSCRSIVKFNGFYPTSHRWTNLRLTHFGIATCLYIACHHPDLYWSDMNLKRWLVEVIL